MNDSYIYAIVALLPLAAVMLTVQVNPYHALVIRGILGAIAALIYAILGAADVALTEALVGTMLAITLYAVAVRSSLVLRIGVLKDELSQSNQQHPFAQQIAHLTTIANKYHLRLELLSYTDVQALHEALVEKEIHIVCSEQAYQNQQHPDPETEANSYYIATRVRRLYNILQTELELPANCLAYVTVQASGDQHQ